MDSMYGELCAHLRRIQSHYNVQFVGMKASPTKGMIIDTIVSWAVAMGKVYVKQVVGSFVTEGDAYYFWSTFDVFLVLSLSNCILFMHEDFFFGSCHICKVFLNIWL